MEVYETKNLIRPEGRGVELKGKMRKDWVQKKSKKKYELQL